MNVDIMWRIANYQFQWFPIWTLASLGLLKGADESAVTCLLYFKYQFEELSHSSMKRLSSFAFGSIYVYSTVEH